MNNVVAIALLKRRTKLVHQKSISYALLEKVYFILFNFMKIYCQRFDADSMEELRVEIRIMNGRGRRKEYEIKTDLFSNFGIFSSRNIGWNLYETTKKTLASIKSRLFY